MRSSSATLVRAAFMAASLCAAWMGLSGEAASQPDPAAVQPPPVQPPPVAIPRPPPRLRLRTVESPGPATEEALKAHLEVRSAALRAGDRAGADLALGLLEEARDALGARNAILPAAILLDEARSALSEGDDALALERSEQAIRLAPSLLGAHWLAINVLIERDATRVATIGAACVRMFGAWGGTFRNQVHLTGLLLATVLVGLAGAVVLVSLVWSAKYLRFIAHDLSRGLPAVVGTGEMAILLVIAVLLPGVLGLGWPSSVALALGLTLAYQRPLERVVSGVGIFAIAVAPWTVASTAPLIAFHGSRVDHLARTMDQALARPSEIALLERLETDPDDGLAYLVLGARAARRRDGERARQLLEKAVALGEEPAVALNDLGVVELRLGEHDQAERRFEEAARLGGYAEPLVNSSFMAGDRGDFNLAERLMRSAREIDPAVAERAEARAGLPTDHRLMLLGVPSMRLWSELYHLGKAELGATRRQLWQWVGGGSPEWTIPAWSMFALAIGLLGFRTRPRSRACSRCGVPAVEEGTSVTCTQCQSVFGGARGISTAARAAKERDVRAHLRARRISRALASLLPGLRGLLEGKTLLGGTLLTLACVVLALLLTRHGLWMHAWHIPGDGSGRHLVGIFVGMVMTSMVSVSVLRMAWRR